MLEVEGSKKNIIDFCFYVIIQISRKHGQGMNDVVKSQGISYGTTHSDISY